MEHQIHPHSILQPQILRRHHPSADLTGPPDLLLVVLEVTSIHVAAASSFMIALVKAKHLTGTIVIVLEMKGRRRSHRSQPPPPPPDRDVRRRRRSGSGSGGKKMKKTKRRRAKKISPVTTTTTVRRTKKKKKKRQRRQEDEEDEAAAATEILRRRRRCGFYWISMRTWRRDSSLRRKNPRHEDSGWATEKSITATEMEVTTMVLALETCKASMIFALHEWR
ncbi:hypothetical protein PIB30_093716 [Stylosanthes scabra]|uniref:Uncharacterized protein n=1 Tax=Stylosanthes scabra TaxID=79078 RepID=A0ABU6XXQ2_9FABA|nr:hypothetical protein [Stylosanthes scabra]